MNKFEQGELATGKILEKTQQSGSPVRRLYLAHSIDARKEVRAWELAIEKRFNIELVNPFYDSAERAHIERLDAGTITRFDVDPDFIVKGDIAAILDSQGIVAIVGPQTTYGTIMEIVYAYLNHKPVYLVVTNGFERHCWFRYHATVIFTNLQELEEYIGYMVSSWHKEKYK